MISQNVIAACQNLFEARSFIATGMLSSLRPEDVKIALAKRLRTPLLQKPVEEKVRQQTLVRDYVILTNYIKENNLDVVLALEYHTDTAPGGSAYLYPIGGSPTDATRQYVKTRSKDTLYFKGTLPPRKIRFGTFLYYKGIISYFLLMESLAWQKNQRPLLGQIAMQIGHLKPEEFARIIIHLKNGECFGTVACKSRILTEGVISAIVKSQEKYDCRLGRYFLEKGILTHGRLEELNRDMEAHNIRYAS